MEEHDRRKLRKLTHAITPLTSDYINGTASHLTPIGMLQSLARQMGSMLPQYVFWRFEKWPGDTNVDWIAAVLLRGKYVWTSDRHKVKLDAKMHAAERALEWYYSSSPQLLAPTVPSGRMRARPARYPRLKAHAGFEVEFDWSVPALKKVTRREWVEWENAPTTFKEFFTGVHVKLATGPLLPIKALESNPPCRNKDAVPNLQNNSMAEAQFLSQLLTSLKDQGSEAFLANMRLFFEHFNGGIAKQVSSMSMRDDMAFGILHATSKGYGDHSIGGDGRVWTIADKFLKHTKNAAKRPHPHAGEQSKSGRTSQTLHPQAPGVTLQTPKPIITPSENPQAANCSVSYADSSSVVVQTDANPTAKDQPNSTAIASESSSVVQNASPPLLSSPYNQVIKYTPRLSMSQLAHSLAHSPRPQNSHTSLAHVSSSSDDSEDVSMCSVFDDVASTPAKDSSSVQDTYSQTSVTRHSSVPRSLTTPLSPSSDSADPMDISQTIDDTAVRQLSDLPTNALEQSDQQTEQATGLDPVAFETSLMDLDENSKLDIEKDLDMADLDEQTQSSDEGKHDGLEMDTKSDGEEGSQDGVDEKSDHGDSDEEDDGGPGSGSGAAAVLSTTHDDTMTDAPLLDYDSGSDTLSDPPSDPEDPFDEELSESGSQGDDVEDDDEEEGEEEDGGEEDGGEDEEEGDDDEDLNDDDADSEGLGQSGKPDQAPDSDEELSGLEV
ncbi:hypothetical protein BKA65DRAFT_482503 [Rhexocercosporidium sp. MPI-PUGE-AT-0058]|nr:hypothetical protein BKA65DRAFT_482503 [Rhexocercosporidium sp. MPI-PUGE-AT-0058]